jgi:hypothetical protein
MFRGSAPWRALLVATLWPGKGLVGLQILYERCAGIDVGKDIIAVAVRAEREGPDGRKTIKRTFTTFYGVLRECARWLTGQGVTHVALEATGIYSMPVSFGWVCGSFRRSPAGNQRAQPAAMPL